MSDMEFAEYQLAQLNVGRLRYPRDAPQMRDYCEALGPVGQIARNWPGFIWIHDNEETIGIAADLFGPGLAANLSVWRDIESLRGFMECPPHAAVMKRRSEWFVPTVEATFVLWWIPAGYIPDFREGRDRLIAYRRNGPRPTGFDLDTAFPPPGGG
jgi:hypothetical protein